MITEIKAADDKVVTEEMIGSWSTALDNDEWPEGWHNVGEIVEGKPRAQTEKSVVMSYKLPESLKRAAEREAKKAGMSTSAYARLALEEKLVGIA